MEFLGCYNNYGSRMGTCAICNAKSNTNRCSMQCRKMCDRWVQETLRRGEVGKLWCNCLYNVGDKSWERKRRCQNYTRKTKV